MPDISKVVLPDNVEYEIKDAKARMVILKYGISTWNDFITAYNNNCVVYCRASSNSNPASGSQTRLAFMAYVDNETTPTNVEFQYYRSVNKHTDAQQGDQVFVYKLTNANKWTVTTRNAFSKVIAGDNITSTFVESGTTSSITLNADYDSTVTSGSTKLITSGAVASAIAALPDPIQAITLAEWNQLTPEQQANGQYVITDATTAYLAAEYMPYDNTTSGLIATDVQDAIDEVNAKITDTTESNALNHLGFYLDANGGLCQVNEI